MNLRIAVERPGEPLSVETIPYTARALHDEVDGWFEHFHLGLGLVYCRRQTRDEVEDDLQQPAPWYADLSDTPCFFVREGHDGGFESLTDADIAILRMVVQ